MEPMNETEMHEGQVENQEEMNEEMNEEMDENGEGTEEQKAKTSTTAKATLKATNLVKNRYKFDQIAIGEKNYYFLQANSMSFDRILRRAPREVNKRADDYLIPLGTTCNETIINAYGLSNPDIYHDEQWLAAIEAFNKNQSEETCNRVLNLLQSAAYLKYLRVSGKTVNTSTSNHFDLISAVVDVNPADIVNYFCEMVR